MLLGFPNLASVLQDFPFWAKAPKLPSRQVCSSVTPLCDSGTGYCNRSEGGDNAGEKDGSPGEGAWGSVNAYSEAKENSAVFDSFGPIVTCWVFSPSFSWTTATV
jgi:hypothetical protein